MSIWFILVFIILASVLEVIPIKFIMERIKAKDEEDLNTSTVKAHITEKGSFNDDGGNEIKWACYEWQFNGESRSIRFDDNANGEMLVESNRVYWDPQGEYPEELEIYVDNKTGQWKSREQSHNIGFLVSIVMMLSIFLAYVLTTWFFGYNPLAN